MTHEDLNNKASTVPRRVRKPRAAFSETSSTLTVRIIEERQYEAALNAPAVQAALFEFEGALLRRDSISRKLCGGSTAVTVDDLARWEKALAGAKKTLAQLAHGTPILVKHPAFGSVVVLD